MPQEEYFMQALYTVDIGSNDLAAAYFSNKSADEFLPNTMAEFSRVIQVRTSQYLNTCDTIFMEQRKPIARILHRLYMKTEEGTSGSTTQAPSAAFPTLSFVLSPQPMKQIRLGARFHSTSWCSNSTGCSMKQ